MSPRNPDTSRPSFLPARCGAHAVPALAPDPDHHLWRNRRLWWVAFTVHRPGWTKERVRLSLGTADLEEARRRRDRVLDEFDRDPSCTLSLRYEPSAR